jgi:hypothetical protein
MNGQEVMDGRYLGIGEGRRNGEMRKYGSSTNLWI